MNILITNHVGWVKFIPLFFLLLITSSLLLGWFFGKYRVKKTQSVTLRDSLVTAIFSLSALVLAFTFSSANEHFNNRSIGIRTQALLLENTYESCSYLNLEDKTVAQRLLRDLLQQRLDLYKDIKNLNQFDNRISDWRRKLNQFNEFITMSIPRASSQNKDCADKILGTLSGQMSDAFKAEMLNVKNHPPAIIEGFLLILLMTGALLSGYAMAVKREDDWFLAMIYLALIGFTLVVIFSLEIPYQLMNQEVMNHELLEVQRLMGSYESDKMLK
jgi:hypothetical protein